MRDLLVKKDFQLFYCFLRGSPFVHECSANQFRSLFAHFLWFSFVKTTRNRKSSLKIVISSVILNTSLPFWFKILSWGLGNFQFAADFYEYTLNMTSYHATKTINGYF